MRFRLPAGILTTHTSSPSETSDFRPTRNSHCGGLTPLPALVPLVVAVDRILEYARTTTGRARGSAGAARPAYVRSVAVARLACRWTGFKLIIQDLAYSYKLQSLQPAPIDGNQR